MPLIVWLLQTLGADDDRLVRKVCVSSAQGAKRLLAQPARNHAVIMARRIGKSVLQAVGGPVGSMAAVEAAVTDTNDQSQELRKKSSEMKFRGRLTVLESPYRSSTTALQHYLDCVQKRRNQAVL